MRFESKPESPTSPALHRAKTRHFTTVYELVWFPDPSSPPPPPKTRFFFKGEEVSGNQTIYEHVHIKISVYEVRNIRRCTNVHGRYKILWRLNACANSVNQAFPFPRRLVQGVQSESSLITTTLYIIYYVTTDLISHE